MNQRNKFNIPPLNLALYIIIGLCALILFGRCSEDAERDRRNDAKAKAYRERVRRAQQEGLD